MSNDLQHIAHSCLRTTDRVIDALINTASAARCLELRNSVQILLVGLPILVVLLPFSTRAVRGFVGVVFGARDGMTDVPRISLGAGTRCPLSAPRLLSCWVCRPESIALTQPGPSLPLAALPLPSCETLLNPVWSALVIGRITVCAIYAASKAWLRARPTVPPAILAAMWGTAMQTIMKTMARAA